MLLCDCSHHPHTRACRLLAIITLKHIHDIPVTSSSKFSLTCEPMNFFSVCSCDDRKSKEARKHKEAPAEAPDSSSPAVAIGKDPLFDGPVLARSPLSNELGRSFDSSQLDGRTSPVPRAAAALPRTASDGKEPSPSPLPSPSSRRSWRHAMAEVIPATSESFIRHRESREQR
jgi:hypothetical protein